MTRYLVVTCRNLPAPVPSAVEAVRAEPGVEVVDDRNPQMAVIEARDEVADELRKKLAATHLVERESRRGLHNE